jgi:hypothetical protein
MLAFLLVLFLVLKYLYSLAAFPGVPFGYDAGIYRYLFLRHAEGWPPVALAPMAPWATAHPLGLFPFSTLLLRIGIPVDWLIGWMWNLVPVIALLVLAHAWWQRTKRGDIGLLILLVGLLSTVTYQGFLMMYIKVFVALLWSFLAFASFEHRKRRMIVYGMMAIATHQQIGLILLLALFSSILSLRRTHQREELCDWVLLCALGGLWYVPVWSQAIGDIVPRLVSSLPAVLLGVFLVAIVAVAVVHGKERLRSLHPAISKALIAILPLTIILLALFSRTHGNFSDASAGAFWTIPQYLQYSFPLLLLGLIGLHRSFRLERGTPWQWAALWCALAVVTGSFFYRRFLLPLDVYLLPFAALAIHGLWHERRRVLARCIVIALLVVQCALGIFQLHSIDPHVDRSMLQTFAALPSAVEPGSQVVVLDIMAPWVLGYLPQNPVSGPGIFDSQPLSAWERFLYGSHDERRAFIEHYPTGTYFLATGVFRSFYGSEVLSLLDDPCFTPTFTDGLVRSVCGAGS